MNIRFRKKGSRSYYRACRMAVAGAVNNLKKYIEKIKKTEFRYLNQEDVIKESELILCYLNFEYKRLDEIVESKVCEK